jgi:hypothetical protein
MEFTLNHKFFAEEKIMGLSMSKNLLFRSKRQSMAVARQPNEMDTEVDPLIISQLAKFGYTDVERCTMIIRDSHPHPILSLYNLISNHISELQGFAMDSENKPPEGNMQSTLSRKITGITTKLKKAPTKLKSYPLKTTTSIKEGLGKLKLKLGNMTAVWSPGQSQRDPAAKSTPSLSARLARQKSNISKFGSTILRNGRKSFQVSRQESFDDSAAEESANEDCDERKYHVPARAKRRQTLIVSLIKSRWNQALTGCQLILYQRTLKYQTKSLWIEQPGNTSHSTFHEESPKWLLLGHSRNSRGKTVWTKKKFVNQDQCRVLPGRPLNLRSCDLLRYQGSPRKNRASFYPLTLSLSVHSASPKNHQARV